MGRAKQRADRLRAEVPILKVLEDYGYRVTSDWDREQQFQCDLHGDGLDNKPSARVYPDSHQWYCFACQRSRDVIQTVREKEGLDFWNAVKSLERKFNLPELPWAQDDKSEDEEEAENLTNNIQDMLFSQRSFEDERVRVETLLTSVTNDRELPQDTVLGFWEVFDRVCYGFEAEKWPDQKAKAGLLSLRTRVMERLASAAA
jgi:DNA primase